MVALVSLGDPDWEMRENRKNNCDYRDWCKWCKFAFAFALVGNNATGRVRARLRVVVIMRRMILIAPVALVVMIVKAVVPIRP